MSHETIALVLWLMLATDLVFTAVGIATRSWTLVLVAAAMSVVFGLLAIFSIGIVILVLAVIQGSVAWTLRRQTRASPRE